MIPGAFIARHAKKWSRHDGVRMGTVVITGAAGFVGFHACVRLMALGHKVVGVDNLGPLFFPSLKHARLEALQKSADFVFHKLDLADHGVFEDLVAQVRPDVIIHLAAQTGVRYSAENPGIYVKNNVEAFTNVLQAARLNSVPRLLYASSSSVYGEGDGQRSEAERADQPVSFYAATKRANELMAYSYASQFGLPSVGMRFFTVYGPYGRPDMAVWTFTGQMLRGQPVSLYNNGQMQRDFTYVDDVVQGIVRLMEVPLTGALSVNVGSGRSEPLARLIEVLSRVTGSQPILNPMPMQAGDVSSTWSSCDRLFELTGHRTGISLDVGIPKFVDWFSKHPSIVDAVEAERVDQ